VIKHSAVIALFFVALSSIAWGEENKGRNSFLLSANYTAGSVMEGTSFRIIGATMEYEDQWSKNLLGVSGYAVGFRKDDLPVDGAGYALTARLFHAAPLARRTSVLFGAGAEWIIPSNSYSVAKYSYDADGELESWQRTFVRTNSWAPHGTRRNSRWNPVVDVRLQQRWKGFQFFGGTQVRPMIFGTDTYTARNNSFRLSEERRLVFTYFAGFGYGF
jgi:hypothetical protein